MNHKTPRRTQQNTPEFLTKIRAKSAARLPPWLDWHFASIAIALIAFALLLWVLSPVLAPFFAATILAYIFDPLVDMLEKRGLSRTPGTVVAVFVLLIALALLLLIILPLFYTEIAQLTQMIPNFVEHLKTSVLPWINTRFGVDMTLDPSVIRQFMQDNLTDAGGLAKRLFATVGTGGLAIVGVLVNLALIPIVLFYVLRDWNVLVSKIGALIPLRQRAAVALLTREIDTVLSEFLRGQLLVMLTMAVFYVVGLWAVGLKFALPVGLITGLLVFVPYLGVGLGVVLGTVAAVMQFSSGSFTSVAMVWAVFALGQIIEGFFITPKFVGDRIGLHPVAVIFALLAFGQLFGFFGVLLALPASAAILVGMRHLKARYQSSDLFQR